MSPSDDAIHIGSRRELLVDDALIDGRQDIDLRLNPPTHPHHPQLHRKRCLQKPLPNCQLCQQNHPTKSCCNVSLPSAKKSKMPHRRRSICRSHPMAAW